MINEELTFEKQESKGFTLLNNDVYAVELLDVNVEDHNKYQSTETEKILSFEFAILDGKDAEGKDARGRLITKNFVPTYLYISSKKGKNWLYKIVEALIGRELNQEEETNGITSKTVNFLIGKQCRVLLEKNVSKTDATKTYSNIVNMLVTNTPAKSLTDKEKLAIKENKAKGKEDVMAMATDNGGQEINPADIPF